MAVYFFTKGVMVGERDTEAHYVNMTAPRAANEAAALSSTPARLLA